MSDNTNREILIVSDMMDCSEGFALTVYRQEPRLRSP
jgi:hypothetical protein